MAIFSYDPALPEDRDWIRFLTGDTKDTNPELNDMELDALLADEDAPEPEYADEEVTPAQIRAYRYRVAARAAEAIAGKYARESDVSFENQRVALSAKFAQYRTLAKELTAKAHGVSGGAVRLIRS
jgi:hypothetical protein